ncbi:unnamed protein product (macronuclear) [Paramecium tetraurelia]|uniref:Tudor domain-containing protein n=1 Tax=Paramecium tetraurelia TaxID=5888 RepID=A0E5Z3_PARTE|nr:uncharacterized protein GSPATT00003573001 [Paramecium tetraurelia]CAK90710.1 unnamed protein product [Paramecium tetraurelia]|eukprot:XP_001458107.1 hypothetical protein (macronuclear) [Paramecium tetraurelia strain d4-2]
MALQPCKILSLISPNQFLIQTQQQKTIIVGNGIPNFLTRSKTNINQKAIDVYFQQLRFVNKEALYITKANQLQINGAELQQDIPDETEIHLKLIGVQNENPNQTQQVQDFIKQHRNKSLDAILVSFEGNILNFLYNKETLISLIPSAIYIDEFAIQDSGYSKIMQKEWLNKEFTITFKGTQIMTVIHERNSINFPILKADLYLSSQQNNELSNEFYISLISNGYAFITDWGKLNLSQNSFQLLFQSQEEAKKNNLGLWKNGELDRRMLNSVSSQTIGQIVEIVEANQYIVKTDKEILTIKLDRIFIEGLEAKEFARKLLIGKQVHILQVGDNIPLQTIQLCDNNLDIEDELIANGWATPKENHPQLSKFKFQQFQQMNLLAKQKKLGQYSPELTWRIEDQTDQKQGKSVNEIIWSSIQRDKQSSKQSGMNTGITIKDDNQLEVLIDKILPNGNFVVTILKYHSMVNFTISGIAMLSEFATSFPNVTKYEEKKQQFIYNILIQRNAWIHFESFNILENMFYGKIYEKKNNKDSDFTLQLLKEGLTFIKNNTDFYSKYEDAQKEAEKLKKGFWNESYAQFIIDFSQNKQTLKKQISNQGNIQKNENQQIQKVTVTAVNDCHEFYLRKENNPEFEELEIQIEKAALIPLKKPVKKGTLCLARFSEDNRIYRAQVLQAFKNDKFLIKFIDYGNNDEVSYQDMGVLPAQFTNVPQQAKMCSLAYLRVPPSTHEYAEEASDLFRELLLDQQFDSKVAYTEKSSNRQFVTLQPQDQPDELQFTINKIVLEKGLGRIDDRVLYNPLKEFKNYEIEAKGNGIGIWGFDDCLEDEKQFEDEYDFYD